MVQPTLGEAYALLVWQWLSPRLGGSLCRKIYFQVRHTGRHLNLEAIPVCLFAVLLKSLGRRRAKELRQYLRL